MKKAIIILAHQLPDQLNRFCSQLLVDHDADIYIHVNKLCEGIIPQVMSDERIYLSKNNIPIYWGSDDILKAIINMYREVLETKKDYKYILVCSGQDLLVREGLDVFLEKNEGTPFIGAFHQSFYEKYNRASTLYLWPDFMRKNYENRFHPYRIARGLWRKYCMSGGRLGRKQLAYNVSDISFAYYNHAWPVLPIEIVKYMVKYIDDNPEYMKIWQNAFDPEEMFFSIFIMNSPYADRIVFKDQWSKSLLFQYKQIGYENHPPILTMADVKNIEKSECFFARKFDIRIDRDVITYYVDKICK